MINQKKKKSQSIVRTISRDDLKLRLIDKLNQTGAFGISPEKMLQRKIDNQRSVARTKNRLKNNHTKSMTVIPKSNNSKTTFITEFKNRTIVAGNNRSIAGLSGFNAMSLKNLKRTKLFNRNASAMQINRQSISKLA